MQVLDTHHRQCFDSDHRRQPRRVGGSGHVGDHFVRGRQRHQRAAHWLADAALRHRAHVHRLACWRSPSHRLLCGLAWNLESLVVLPRPAGRRVRPDGARLAGAAAAVVPARQERTGAGALVDDHAGRAHHGSDARRLDLGQRHLAVDFLYQHSGRHIHRGGVLAPVCAIARRRRASCRSTPSACRCWWCGSARCRSCWTRARTRIGSPRRSSSSLGIDRGDRVRCAG